MKKKYISPEVLIISAESGNLILASNVGTVVGSDLKKFEPNRYDGIEIGEEQNNATPAKDYWGGSGVWED